MSKSVLIISTMDTKGEETLYLKDRVAAFGLTPVLMDLAMRGVGPSPADITPAQVAAAGGSSLDDIRSSSERSRITNITIAGASALARDLLAEGRLDAVVGPACPPGISAPAILPCFTPSSKYRASPTCLKT